MPSTGTNQDKQIKLGVGVDENETRRALNLMREVLRETQKVNREFARMGQAFDTTSRQGGNRSAGTSTQHQARSTPNPAQAVSRQLLEHRDLFRFVASQSKDALQVMTRVNHEAMAAQQMDVKRLKAELNDLIRSYKEMDDLRSKGIQLADPSSPMRVRGQLIEKGYELMAAGGGGRYVGGGGAGGGVGGGGGGDNPFGRAANFLARQMGFPNVYDGGGGSGGGGNGGGPFGGGGLFGGGAFAGKSGAALQAVQWGMVGSIIGKQIVGAIRSGTNESEQAPWDFVGRATKQGGAYGRAGMAMRQGDLGLGVAMRMVMDNPQLRKDFDAQAGGAGSSTGFSISTSGGIAFDQGGHRVDKAIIGNWLKNKFNFVGQINDTKRAIDNIAPDQAVNLLQMAEAMRTAAPGEFTFVDQLSSNYKQDIGEMRTFGGVGKTDRFGGRVNRGVRAARALENRGLLAEGHAAVSGIEGIGGYGTAMGHYRRAASAMAGRLHAAPQILGQASLGGDAGTFFTGVQNLIGRGSGGIDVAAGSQLGLLASGTIASGAGVTSGRGVLGALGAYARGGSAGEDMMNARFAGAGYGAVGAMVGGKLDPYQSGTNLLASIAANPTGSVFAQEYLAQLDPRTMFDVLGAGPGHQLPADLAAHGITYGMVKQYSDSVFRNSYDRDIAALPGQGGVLTPQQAQSKVVNDQYGGDFRAYLQDKTGGLHGKVKTAAEQRAFELHGAFLAATGQAPDFMSGVESARLIAGRGAYSGSSRMAGRGVGDMAAGSTQMEMNAELSRIQGEDERKREQFDTGLRGSVSQLGKGSKQMFETGNQIGAPAEQVAASLKKLVAAIDAASDRILEKATGRKALRVQAGP